MKIADFYKQKKSPVFSVEVLPPRNGESVTIIDSVVQALRPYPIRYYSVTWGAGGSLRGGTLPITLRIREKFGIEAMAHLTCRDFTKQQVENILVDAKYMGIENILALRGDPPEGESVYQPNPNGYRYASELVEHMVNLRKGLYYKRTNEKDSIQSPFKEGEPYPVCIAVAAHPEGHSESPSLEADRAVFKQKVDSGADLALTQMVFTPEIYENFVDDCRRRGVQIPIVPGIFILPGFGSMGYILAKLKLSLPDDLKKEFERCKDSPDALRAFSVEHTLHLVRRLLRTAPGIHFYSLNNASLIAQVLDRL